VVVEYGKKDKYGRTVGKILVGGVDANLEQVKAGMAWHYKKYQSEQSEADRITYAQAEDRARAGKVGLWFDPEPIPPWDWRKQQKAKG
jgi:endonuclease YncB( thermonuclease family)